MPSKGLATIVIASVCAACSSTPDVRRSFGPAALDAVVTWQTWQVGGVPQDLLVRGRSRHAPMAIVLHGGPGVSETALSRRYLPKLEDHFLMVYWDQPGAGRSYSEEALHRGLSIEAILRDLDEIVDWLRVDYGHDKVALIGHSWGSAVGLLYAARHPQKVSLVLGTGQVASMPEGEAVSYEFSLTQATQRQNLQALRELQSIASPHSVDEMLVSRRWVERFGGTFSAGLSTGQLILAAMQASESSLWDLARFGIGNRASLEALWPTLSKLDLRHAVPDLQVPVVFVLGSLDRVTPTPLAERYLTNLWAPCKRAIVVDGAAHNLPFERPKVFVSVVASLAGQLREGAAPELACEVLGNAPPT